MSLLSVFVDLTILLLVAVVVAFIIRTRRNYAFKLSLLPYVIIGLLVLAVAFMGRLISNLFDIVIILIVVVAILLTQRVFSRKRS